MTSTDNKAQYVDTEEFDRLLNDETLVVADYTASWCGPCRITAPLIDRLADEYQDRARVVKIDIDKHKDGAKKYGIRSIPAVLMFKGGEQVENLVGKKSYEEYSGALEKHL